MTKPCFYHHRGKDNVDTYHSAIEAYRAYAAHGGKVTLSTGDDVTAQFERACIRHKAELDRIERERVRLALRKEEARAS